MIANTRHWNKVVLLLGKYHEYRQCTSFFCVYCLLPSGVRGLASYSDMRHTADNTMLDNTMLNLKQKSTRATIIELEVIAQGQIIDVHVK